MKTLVWNGLAAMLLWPALAAASDPAAMCRAQERFAAGSPPQTAALFKLWDFHTKEALANENTAEGMGAGLLEGDLQRFLAIVRSRNSQELEAFMVGQPALQKRLLPWVRCGYTLMADFDETLRFDTDPVFLRKFEDRLRPKVREYIELYLKESPDRLESDGSLTIPWDRLRARIGRWERFRALHAELPPLAAHIDKQLKFMMEEYLCGTPYSTVFDEHGRLQDFTRESYDRFLKLNTASRFYGVVSAAMKILHKHNGELNHKLIRFYRTQGFSTGVLNPEPGR